MNRLFVIYYYYDDSFNCFCTCLHIRWNESSLIFSIASSFILMLLQNIPQCSINMDIHTSWILFLVKVGWGNVNVCVCVTTEVMSIFVGFFPHGLTAESLCSGGFHWHGQTALTNWGHFVCLCLCQCLHVISTSHRVVMLGKLTVMSHPICSSLLM